MPEVAAASPIGPTAAGAHDGDAGGDLLREFGVHGSERGQVRWNPFRHDRGRRAVLPGEGWTPGLTWAAPIAFGRLVNDDAEGSRKIGDRFAHACRRPDRPARNVT